MLIYILVTLGINLGFLLYYLRCLMRDQNCDPIASILFSIGNMLVVSATVNKVSQHLDIDALLLVLIPVQLIVIYSFLRETSIKRQILICLTCIPTILTTLFVYLAYGV